MIAVFNFAAWQARYPEFNASTGSQPVSNGLADEYFAEAGLYLANTDDSQVPADAVTYQPRLMLLNMLTAHIAALNAPLADGTPASPIVGRISSATEGSVSVTAQMDQQPGSAAWFNQTKYGAAYWKATGKYRRARYKPSCRAAAPLGLGAFPPSGRGGW